ncbi:MAG TPA: hypothetical protein PLP42_03865, partial [Acidobacteriota bacterium]|nr:hypothetical protein [Acidobacteriota bacterium]
MIGSRQSYRVAVIEWNPGDGITRMIRHELEALGHEVTTFGKEDPVPAGQDVVFTFGPYGKVIPLWEKSRRVKGNPATIHWNTEGIPDLRIPAVLVRQLAALRSLVGRVADSENRLFRLTLGSPRLPKLDHRMARFRYVGDYYYAYRKGLLDLLADSSMIYADIHRKAGIPVLYLPWGGSLVSSKDLGMERDIDVLWMGKRGSGRRSRLLDRVRAELKALGVEIYVADGEENPFIFGETRTEYLNRAKVTLNLTRTWYDDNFSRFSMAAPNRSLIVSEPVLPHC